MSHVTGVTQEAEDALIAVAMEGKGGPGVGHLGFPLGGLPAHKGGAGSGNWGHDGRPGKIGGSAPGGGRRVHRAGITSARPGKTTEQVAAEMEPFRRDLSAVAKDVSVSMGIGGWEGGEEPSWVSEYVDGAPAAAVIARYAKKHGQDGALIMKASRKGDPGASPQQSLSFERALDRPAMEVIETQLVKNGVSGWTWTERSGKTSLVVQTVPQWDGDAKNDLAAIQGLRDALTGLGANVTYAQDWATVEALWPGNYDDYIEAGE